jgi:hypothetical protein
MSTDPWQCPSCGYRLQYAVREDLDPVAWHEAGHTLMRWLLLPETLGDTCMHPDGSGYSATSRPGDVIRTEDQILLTLAGPVAEVGMLGGPLDLEHTHSEEVTTVFALLTPAYLRGWLGGHYTQREAFDYYWQRTFQELWRAFDALEALAEQLTRSSILTAAEIRAICDFT